MSLPSLIPLDAPNHDDWNVLFNDFADLEDKLIFSDDCKFFTSDPVERFGILHKVFWTGNLHGRSIARYSPCGVSLRLDICFGSLVFALSMSWVARDDLPISIVYFCFKVHYSCPVLVLHRQKLLLQPRFVWFWIRGRCWSSASRDRNVWKRGSRSSR